jgi:hypothetical protein
MIPSPENWSSVPSNWIAEHDDDLAAMAFEDLLVASRDDEFGKLRCEKPFQPPNPPEFFDLFSDPRLQTAVQFRHFVGPLAQFAQQPCVLHRDHRLRGEVLQQGDLLVGERANFRAVNRENTEESSILEQGYRQIRSRFRHIDQRHA